MGPTVDLYANGKLLLTGEYLVLAGARALAFPLRFGQRMRAIPIDKPLIIWISRDISGLWYRSEFTLPLPDEPAEQGQTDLFVHKILLALQSLNPDFLCNNNGYIIEFDLNYPREWGLGSSSTLIWLMAHLANVNETLLYQLVSEGSGYDLACASRNLPFFYTVKNRETLVEKCGIGRALRHHCCFAYLGKKQDTQSEVRKFLQQKTDISSYINTINIIGEAISHEDDGTQLCRLVKEHENIIAQVTGKTPVGFHFPHFEGAVKSLGAWGGDFAMFVSSYNTTKIQEILKGYGLNTIFTFDELKCNQ